MIDSLKRLLGGATSAIQGVRGASAGIVKELDALTAEDHALLTAYLPPAAVLGNIETLIADLGRRWTARHAIDIIAAASGRIERLPGARPGPPVPPQLADVVLGPVTFDMLCALCPAVLLEGFRRLVEGTEYVHGGALASRLARLEKIAAERATLEGRHAALVDEAEAAGVHLTHLQEETGARFRKAQRLELWERDLAQNRAFYKQHPTSRPPKPE